MTKVKPTYIAEYAALAALTVFLQFTELKTGAEFLAAPFMFAAVCDRRNALILAPVFFVSGVLPEPGTASLAGSGAAVVLLAGVMTAQYLMRRRFRLYVWAAASALAALPYVFFLGDGAGLWLGIAAIPLSALMFFVFYEADYCVKVKKLRFAFGRREKAAFSILFAVAGLGLGYMRISSFSALEPMVILIAQFLSPSPAALTAAGLAVGAGSAVADPYNALMTAIYILPTAFFDKERAYFGAVAGVALQAGAMAAGITEPDYLRLIAPAAAALTVTLIPSAIRSKFTLPVYKEGGGLRTLVNKTRSETAKKIGELASSFSALGEVLALDEEAGASGAEELAHTLQEKCCADCPGRARCMKNLGGGEPEIALRELASTALKNGKVSILDATPFLSSVCVRLRSLIEGANAVAAEEKKRLALAGETGKARSVVKEEVDALSDILGKLSQEISRPLTYSADSEKKIRERLERLAIPVGEAYVYGGKEVTLTIPAAEERRQAVKQEIEAVLGIKLALTGEVPVAVGRTALTYRPQTRYRVAYGVRQMAAGEYGSGDSDRAIRLGNDKVMVVLADGMGHDRAAHVNSGYAVRLIESFARAGFPAEAMLSFTGKLMSVRMREEFNAVDIALIDTETGRTDIIKQGARESFVTFPGEAEVVECGSLPLGIVESEPVIETRTLTPENFLVMVSDGVLDVLGREKTIEILLGVDSVNPDDVAGAVMKEYASLAGDDPDDATVIALRLVESRF